MPSPSAKSAPKKAARKTAKKAVAKKAAAKSAVSKKAVAKKAAAKSTVSKKAVAKKAAAKSAVSKKAVAKKAAAKSAAGKKAAGKHTPVRVRMYRQGLGDCFLLTFDPGGDEVHMLIDCGSLGAETTGNKMEDIVAHIRATTNDHIHLLIATHEHQDHVSGFHTLKKEFQEIAVDNVWMAWTENPADRDAQTLERRKGDLGTAVALAVKVLSQNAAKEPQAAAVGEAMRSVLGFTGEADEILGAAAKTVAKTVDDGMTFVRTGQRNSNKEEVKAEYFSPGGPAIEREWVPGFRFYVLGPPRNVDRMKEMGEDGSSEIYGISASLRAAAAEQPDAATAAQDDTVMPFDARFRRDEADPLVRAGYAEYFKPENQWRRVDMEWLYGSADLALQLDDLTNNTSLALAIERISDGRVLLFPADAQEGHWLSWHEPEVPFSYVQDGTTHTTTAEKLLNKTVFYKVGHHSSHNATAKAKGLEMMTRENELVAFIPVDRKVALKRSPKGTWKMPAKALYRRLLEKCQGRVARSDIGWADDPKNAVHKDVEAEFKDTATAEEWAQWRQSQASAPVTIDPSKPRSLYIDYTLA